MAIETVDRIGQGREEYDRKEWDGLRGIAVTSLLEKLEALCAGATEVAMSKLDWTKEQVGDAGPIQRELTRAKEERLSGWIRVYDEDRSFRDADGNPRRIDMIRDLLEAKRERVRTRGPFEETRYGDLQRNIYAVEVFR